MILLDIMQDDRFVCQLKYTGNPFPSIIDGKVVAAYDSQDLVDFVYHERPSLKGKDFTIEFSDQRVITPNIQHRL